MNNQAELISIGNELLSGQTLNTHAKALGTAVAAIGLQLVRDTTIPDVGPTVDDITREALAKALGREIVLDRPTVETMTQRYAARGRAMTPAAERQALVLEGAAVLPNSTGAAPGQRIALPGDRFLFVLPGPPGEFNGILNEEIIPWLRERFPDARPMLARTVRTAGIGESDIVTLLEKAGFQPEGVTLGFYPGSGRVRIRITADPGNESKIEETEQTLGNLLVDFIS
jgi:nicotinamide-nucleotide amidase